MEKTCALCKSKVEKFVKSHIIPESIFKLFNTQGRHLKAYELDSFAKKMPIGAYDKNILCDSCEKKFNEWDDEGNRLFKNLLATASNNNTKGVYSLHERYNYHNIIWFFTSMAWRASVSNIPFCTQVNIGAYEDNIRQAILNHQDTPSEYIEIIIFYEFNDIDGFKNPANAKRNGVNFVVFDILKFKIYVKFDKRPMLKEWNPYKVTPNSGIRFIALNHLDNRSSVSNNRRFLQNVAAINRI